MNIGTPIKNSSQKQVHFKINHIEKDKQISKFAMSAEKPGKSDKKDGKNPKLRKMILRKKIDKFNQKQKSD